MASCDGTVSLPDHGGLFYQDCLRILHKQLNPRSYLEIGTLHGETLALAQCASIAIDPHFQINQSIVGDKPSVFLFQMTSDAFFRRHSLPALLGGPIDLAFLDGMHLFEHLLRDFTHTEQNCHPGSVIILHDCVPLDLHMAVRDANDTLERSRSRYPLWWAGDVWKLLPILWRHRPDLIITAFNAPPTGLVMVSNLDPESRVLEDHYAEIASSSAVLPGDATLFGDYLARLDIVDTRELCQIIGSIRSPALHEPAATTTGTIVVERLATILEARPSTQGQWAGISDPRLIAPAGSYERQPPVFVDTERATEDTRQQLETYMRVLSQPYGPLHCVSLRKAIVLGQGSVVTRNGILLWESAAEFLAHGHAPDGLRPLDGDTWQLATDPVRDIEEPCLLVKRPWFRNFGHWLVDCATLLAIMRDDISRYGWTIVIGAHDDPMMVRIVQETISLLVPDAPVLRQPDDEPWRFADLRYVTPVHTPPLFKLPAGILRLRELVMGPRDVADDRVARPRRLYLSRQDAGTRSLVNEAELAPLLSGMGFETISPSSLSLSEQAQLFNGAEVIMGIKGAALTNIMFCQPSCSVMVLSPEDFPDPFFWDIAGQLGVRYAELFGPVTTSLLAGRNDFVIDPIAVARMLGAVLRPMAD